MSDKLPYYKRFPRDYLSDENVALMTLEEEGAYNRLMDYSWIHGSIPGDVEGLARLCRVGADKMDELWGGIQHCFNERADGRFVHPRLEKERRKIETKRQKLSEAGRKGARRKKKKRLNSKWEDLLEEVQGVCPRCRKDVGRDMLTLDHIVPQYQGGEDAPDNIQPLCRSCNSSKGPETTDWMERWRNGRPGINGDNKGGLRGEQATLQVGSGDPIAYTESDAESDADTEADTETTLGPNGPSSDGGPERWMHDLWHEYLEIEGHPIKLTETRKKKYRAMHEEQLSSTPDPQAAWAAILYAVTQSDHHMSQRSYQMPESLLRNPERRETWVQRTIASHRNGGGSKADRDFERRRREVLEHLESIGGAKT